MRPAPRLTEALAKAALQPLLDFAMAAVMRRHGGLSERLSGCGEPRYLIDPVDLPWQFVVSPASPVPWIVPIPRGASAPSASATIRGRLRDLIEVLEGRRDGDALFFSRDLVVEGDMEAAVALRNAIENAQVRLFDDLLAAVPAPPLVGPAIRAALARAGEALAALGFGLAAGAASRR